MGSSVPPAFRALFWDVDVSQLSISKHQRFIIERVLNMGDHHALKWLWQTYSRENILEVVQKSRNLSKKTARCWQNFFDLREEEMRCFSTYSMSPGRVF